uniref:Molybdopterin synthase sulfur carrier subunit n=1 Tax=Sphaeramia orbicularis TaxID=375764 RepID=A0A673AMR1_9TELE
MCVCVLYFAQSADLTGSGGGVCAVPTPISSQDLWTLLLRRHPRLGAAASRGAGGASAVRCLGDHLLTLEDGDEVAVVPPLSGG